MFGRRPSAQICATRALRVSRWIPHFCTTRLAVPRALPAFFPIENRLVAIVGGGVVAVRKAALAARFGARIRFIARDFAAETLRAFPAADFVEGDADETSLRGAALIFAAAENRATDAATAALAHRLGIPVNAVDQPEISAFICPAVIDRGDVVVAVSTGGASPVLARRVRQWIEAALPEGLVRLARFAATHRKRLRPRLGSVDASRRVWEAALDGTVRDLVLGGNDAEAEQLLDTLAHASGETPRGSIHLVGAGPGDPDLLTVKALRLLGDADIVFYDRLVAARVLDRIRRDAELVYVGKAPGAHAVPQAEIERQMIAAALTGKRVIRLKGGDPSLFARGAEELDAARVAGVPVFVVPGISAALGAAAAAGISLTDRRSSPGVSFVSGHDATALDVEALRRLDHTLVIYMGRESAGEIAAHLIRGGFGVQTPVCIVERATLPEQRILRTNLAELGALIARLKVISPSLLIIGEVAAARDDRALPALPELIEAVA